MSLNPNKINDLIESIDYLVQINYEVRDEVKTAIGSADYLKAAKILSNYVQILGEFTIKTLNMEQNYRDEADDENASICNKIVKMVECIKIAHLEVEENILEKYIRKKQQ